MINYTMKKSEDNEVEKKSTLAKLLATENIEVQENSASTASFDVKNRILTIPIFKKEHKSKNVYDMLVGHEVAHALWTPSDSWEKMSKKTDEYRSFVNVLEDCRIDKKIQKRYPGLQEDYKKGLLEVDRVLRPDGSFFIANDIVDGDTCGHGDGPLEKPDHIISILDQAGFINISMQKYYNEETGIYLISSKKP